MLKTKIKIEKGSKRKQKEKKKQAESLNSKLAKTQDNTKDNPRLYWVKSNG